MFICVTSLMYQTYHEMSLSSNPVPRILPVQSETPGDLNLSSELKNVLSSHNAYSLCFVSFSIAYQLDYLVFIFLFRTYFTEAYFLMRDKYHAWFYLSLQLSSISLCIYICNFFIYSCLLHKFSLLAISLLINNFTIFLFQIIANFIFFVLKNTLCNFRRSNTHFCPYWLTENLQQCHICYYL